MALRQAGRPAAGARLAALAAPAGSSRLLRPPGPSLDLNPVAWREWHRARPSRMMRVAWGLYAAPGTALGLPGVARPAERPRSDARRDGRPS